MEIGSRQLRSSESEDEVNPEASRRASASEANQITERLDEREIRDEPLEEDGEEDGGKRQKIDYSGPDWIYYSRFAFKHRNSSNPPPISPEDLDPNNHWYQDYMDFADECNPHVGRYRDHDPYDDVLPDESSFFTKSKPRPKPKSPTKPSSPQKPNQKNDPDLEKQASEQITEKARKQRTWGTATFAQLITDPLVSASENKASKGLNNASLGREYGHKLDKLQEDTGFLRDSGFGRPPFPQRIGLVMQDQLFYPYPPPLEGQDKPERQLYTLSLSRMQQINIHAIQRDLVELASQIYQTTVRVEGNDSSGNGDDDDTTLPDWKRLKETMRDYCEALRDWKLVEKYAAGERKEDLFMLTTDNPLSAKIMEDFRLPVGNVLWGAKGKENNYLSCLPGGASRHQHQEEDKIKQVIRLFLWGFGGGLSLIAPMLLMRLHRTLLTQLLTAGVSVMLFAFGVAIAASGIIRVMKPISMEPKDVLTAVAAYAAVLVVFISQDQ